MATRCKPKGLWRRIGAVHSQAARTRQRGSVMLEFALVGVVLVTLVFGIVEVSLIFKDQTTLGQAAREGARSLSLNSSTSVAAARVYNTSNGLLNANNCTVTSAYSTDNGATFTGTISDSTDPAGHTYNNIPPGDLIKMTIAYQHPLMTKIVATGSTISMHSSMVMRKE